MKNLSMYIVLAILLLSVSQLSYAQAKRGEIQHDAEHYMLLPQHGENGHRKMRPSRQGWRRFAMQMAASLPIFFSC